MPSINLNGARNFSITGGNFNDVAGNVFTYNFGSEMENLSPNAFANIVAPNGNSNTGGHTPRRGRNRLLPEHRRMGELLPSAHIDPSSIPTSPSASAMNASPSPNTRSRRSRHTNSHSSPGNLTPSPTNSSADFEFRDLNTPSPRSSSGSLTPPTDIEEHRSVGTSGAPSSNPQQANVDLLTPLTNSLGLERFTPGTQPHILPTLHETPAPAQADVRNLSPIDESPPPFGLQLPPAAGAHSPGPPPVPPRLSSQLSPSTQSHRMQFQVPMQERESRPLGPPPPVPPRPGMLSPTWTNVTAPFDTPFRTSPSVVPLNPSEPPALAPLPLHLGSSELGSGFASTPTAVNRDLEDPATLFARLQAQRSTKGYASDLGSSSRPATGAYTPSAHSNSPLPSPPPPPPASTRPLSRSPSGAGTPAHPPSLPEGGAGQPSHWTSNSISGWVGDVSQPLGGSRLSDSQSSRDSLSVQPPSEPKLSPMTGQYEELHRYQPPSPSVEHQRHYQDAPFQNHYANNARQNPYMAPWGGSHQQQQPRPPFGYNQAPQPPFPGFPFNAPAPAPAFILPPFGAPQFGGPAFNGPPAGTGIPFYR